MRRVFLAVAHGQCAVRSPVDFSPVFIDLRP
jgi:hypothetical protein